MYENFMDRIHVHLIFCPVYNRSCPEQNLGQVCFHLINLIVQKSLISIFQLWSGVCMATFDMDTCYYSFTIQF